jgi:DNA-binding CsgD family transcriptional regulator
MTPRQREAFELYKKLGSNCAVARALGVHESTVRGLIRLAKTDAGIQEAIERTGLSTETARHGWRRVQNPETGNWDSVFWTAPKFVESFIEQLRDAFDGLTRADPIQPPETVVTDLCTVYPLMDVHFGMLAHEEETGSIDYNMKRATEDMRLAFAKIGALTPNSSKAILIIGGDFFHANDQTNQTPTNHHQLDVEARHWKVLRAGVDFLGEVIETIASKHSSVSVRVLRGNHDPEAHKVLTFAMAERYADSSHIRIDQSPTNLFMSQWGKCLIAAHHGDKMPPEKITLYLSDVCPYWSETRHRYCFTGHVHKDQSRDVGPLRWESLRAFAPPDAYASSMGYSGRRAMQALTFHRRDGLVLRAIDPIEA